MLSPEQIAEQKRLAHECMAACDEGLVPLKSSELKARGTVLVHFNTSQWWHMAGMDLNVSPAHEAELNDFCEGKSLTPREAVERRAYLVFVRELSAIKKARRNGNTP